MKAVLLIPLAMLSPLAAAHYIPSQDNPTTVDASLVANWRSASLIGDYDYWQIPGTLMGGHAWPARKGFALDEMTLSLAHRLDDNLFAVIELGSHASGGDEHGGVELEHAYLGWVCCDDLGPWVVEVGKMGSRFSPALSLHESSRLSAEVPLIHDVFFGRHFHDEGIRFWWHETAGLTLGVEVWKGKAFPSSDSEDGGAWDVFGRYKWQGQRVMLEAGGWFYSAQAQSRADHRYGGGHQHVPVAPPGQTATIFPDVRYTGDTDIIGLHGRLSYQVNDRWQAGVEAEWMQAELSGSVHDNVGRRASLEATQSGAWLQPFVRYGAHILALRAEQVMLDNKVTGAAAVVLSNNSGLANPLGDDPRRLSLTWRWQWRENLALRAEAVRDDSLTDTEQRLVLGVIWQQRVWPAGQGQGDSHNH